MEVKMVNYGIPNASAATGTKNRVSDPAPSSGICSVCLDGCPGLCEIGKSSFRGREVIYPVPFGKVTAGAVKAISCRLFTSEYSGHMRWCNRH